MKEGGRREEDGGWRMKDGDEVHSKNKTGVGLDLGSFRRRRKDAPWRARR